MTMKIQDIQFLRQETGAGIMDCKNALNKTNGDLQQALAGGLAAFKA